MGKATPKPDGFTPLTGADVAARFEEYMEGKQRRRPVPNAEQCLPIAQHVNKRSKMRSVLDMTSWPTWKRLNDYAGYQAEAAEEAKRLRKSLLHMEKNLKEENDAILLEIREEDARLRLLQSEGRLDIEDFQGYKDGLDHLLEASREKLEKIASFSRSIDIFLSGQKGRPKGRPETEASMKRLEYKTTQDLMGLIESAMTNAGWGKISFKANGPATHVLAECLSYISGNKIEPKTLARRLAESHKLCKKNL